MSFYYTLFSLYSIAGADPGFCIWGTFATAGGGGALEMYRMLDLIYTQ